MTAPSPDFTCADFREEVINHIESQQGEIENPTLVLATAIRLLLSREAYAHWENCEDCQNFLVESTTAKQPSAVTG